MNEALDALVSKVSVCQSTCNRCYNASLKEDDIDLMRTTIFISM